MTIPSTIVIGFGNPGRLDDGLGPALAERIAADALDGVTATTDYQLNIEHAAEIAAHDRAIFVDASAAGDQPCFLRRLLPRPGASFSTHAVAPEAIIALAEQALGWRGEAYLLGVRGVDFDGFGERLSPPARANLETAAAVLLDALRRSRLADATTDGPICDSLLLRNSEPCNATSP
ncbi:MAG: hydrogenase maturation protease [Phycisphaerales bacterium JB039]